MKDFFKVLIHGFLSICFGWCGLHYLFARRWIMFLLKLTPFPLGKFVGSNVANYFGDLSSMFWAWCGVGLYVFGILWWGADIIMTMLGIHEDADGVEYKFSDSWGWNSVCWVGVVISLVWGLIYLTPAIKEFVSPTDKAGRELVLTADFHLRESAEVSSTTLINMPKGTTVTVHGKHKGEWTPVEYEGKQGFIMRDYYDKKEKTATATGNITLREDISTTSVALASIPKGGVMIYNGSNNNNWHKVIYNGIKGWVRSEDIKIDGQNW